MRFQMKRSLLGGAGADPDPQGTPTVVGTIPDEALLTCPPTLRNSDTIPGRALLTMEGTAGNTAVVELWALDDVALDRGASAPLRRTTAQQEAREFALLSTVTVTVGELTSGDVGMAAAVATLLGVAGTFPTGFTGGETLLLRIEGISFTVTFAVGDQSGAQVIAEINAEALAAGIPVPPASFATEILLTGSTTGSAGNVTVLGGSGAAILGLSGSEIGSDAVASLDNFPGGTLYARVTTTPAADATLKVACAK